MNRILLCLFLFFSGLTASSQKVYFIYFQSETDQPFFLKMGDKVHSSTGTGYLILSKLRDSTYSFSLGFPDNKWPEQRFTVSIEKKDHGFLIKNFGEKGWGLFNLQTLAVQMPVPGSAKAEEPQKKENKEVSDFTEVLSKAADDPSLKDKPVQPKPEEKAPVTIIQEIPKSEQPEPVKKDAEPVRKAEPAVVKKEIEEKPAAVTIEEKTIPEKKAEPAPVVKEEAKAVAPAEQPAVQQENKQEETEYKRSVVKRRSESSTTEGFGLVFIDEYEPGSADTIKLLIPNPKPLVVPVVVKEEPKEEKKFLDIAAPDTLKAQEVKKVVEELPAEKPVVEKAPAEKKEEKQVAANNCAATAGETDFLEVRKQMAAETSDENMITEARKYFKIKCFSAQQIRNLSLLFLNEEGKYRFFDMSYPYVADPANFPSLEAELKDTYYINRFRAMLRL